LDSFSNLRIISPISSSVLFWILNKIFNTKIDNIVPLVIKGDEDHMTPGISLLKREV